MRPGYIDTHRTLGFVLTIFTVSACVLALVVRVACQGFWLVENLHVMAMGLFLLILARRHNDPAQLGRDDDGGAQAKALG